LRKTYITDDGKLSPVLTEVVIETVLAKYHGGMPDNGYGTASHKVSPIYKLFAFLE
jgi:hypothetical protein